MVGQGRAGQGFLKDVVVVSLAPRQPLSTHLSTFVNPCGQHRFQEPAGFLEKARRSRKARGRASTIAGCPALPPPHSLRPLGIFKGGPQRLRPTTQRLRASSMTAWLGRQGWAGQGSMAGQGKAGQHGWARQGWARLFEGCGGGVTGSASTLVRVNPRSSGFPPTR